MSAQGPNPHAIKFARNVFERMFCREATAADADALVELVLAIESTEVIARQMSDQNVAAERTACASICDAEYHPRQR